MIFLIFPYITLELVESLFTGTMLFFFHAEYKNDYAYAVFICSPRCMYMENTDHKNYCRKKRNEYAVYETVFY